MEILNRIMDMQRRGFSDSQISEQLQDEGISPRQINEGLNQANIKKAILPPQDPPMPPFPEDSNEGYYPEDSPENYPLSQGEQNIYPPGQIQAPSQQKSYSQENQNLETPDPGQGYYPQAPQAYSGNEYYMPNAGPDIGTTTEIIDQVVSEKFIEFEKKTGDIKSFQTLISDKVADLDARLKNIERTIDKLSSAIIGKIGEFGQDAASIRKDLDNLHGTVSKLMNPLIDNLNELKRISR